MKAPLRATDSSTIEKLRAWLAAELEPLEIDNNVQYAHHVVTIFLNNTDVEDEPLSPPNDFLRELENLRAGKSLDQKKRAAVQFLTGVIPLEKQPIPRLIGQLIDELVVRVESTKVRTPKKVLGPISINVETLRTAYRKYRIGQERCYDEAFPSLPAEAKMNAVTMVLKKGACADGWLRSSNSSETVQKSKKRTVARKITFVDKSEDAVCVRTGLLHLVPVPNKSLSSPVTIEVDESSLEVGIFSGGVLRLQYESEWKSAFVKVHPTAVLYSPKIIHFPLPLDVSSPARPNSWSLITVVSNDKPDQSVDVPRLVDKVDLLDEDAPKVFIHIERKAPELPLNTLFALDEDDLEVSNIISWSHIDEQRLKHRTNELTIQMKRHRNGNRQRQRSPINSDNSGLNGSGVAVQFLPLEGAVGGGEEVKTDDLFGFAMEQIENRNEGRRAAFDIVLPEQEERLAIYIGMDNGEDCLKGFRGSADSGMFPGGEEESRLNLCGWADGVGSPSGWLEPASVWRKAAQSSDLGKWRKTPGCAAPDDGAENNGAAALHMEESNNDDEAGQNWTGWKDPIPDPDCSWDSIRKDIFRLSPFPPDDPVFDAVPDNVSCPLERSCNVNQNVAQKMQSAFINTMFAQGTASGPIVEIEKQSSHMILDCSELEQRWLSHQSEDSSHMAPRSRLNIVRGKTCSNWLEGVCNLGKQCPFSHPSI